MLLNGGKNRHYSFYFSRNVILLTWKNTYMLASIVLAKLQTAATSESLGIIVFLINS